MSRLPSYTKHEMSFKQISNAYREDCRKLAKLSANNCGQGKEYST
jgi:hypothetical protein